MKLIKEFNELMSSKMKEKWTEAKKKDGLDGHLLSNPAKVLVEFLYGDRFDFYCLKQHPKKLKSMQTILPNSLIPKKKKTKRARAPTRHRAVPNNSTSSSRPSFNNVSRVLRSSTSNNNTRSRDQPETSLLCQSASDKYRHCFSTLKSI